MHSIFTELIWAEDCTVNISNISTQMSTVNVKHTSRVILDFKLALKNSSILETCTE